MRDYLCSFCSFQKISVIETLYDAKPYRWEAEKTGARGIAGHVPTGVLDRIDAAIVFKRLDARRIREIVDIQMRSMARLIAQRDLEIELTESAKDFLAKVGYEPAFGARPLRRTIQEHVLEPLSEKIIAGEIRPGQRVVVDRGSDGLTMGGVPRPELTAAMQGA